MHVAMLAFSAFAASPAPAMAQQPASTVGPNWQLISRAGGDQAVTTFWDAASVVRDGGLVRVTERVRLTMTGIDHVSEHLVEIRCAEGAWREIRATFYNPGGDTMTRDTPANSPQAHFQPISPDSDLATIRAAVC